MVDRAEQRRNRVYARIRRQDPDVDLLECVKAHQKELCDELWAEGERLPVTTDWFDWRTDKRMWIAYKGEDYHFEGVVYGPKHATFTPSPKVWQEYLDAKRDVAGLVSQAGGLSINQEDGVVEIWAPGEEIEDRKGDSGEGPAADATTAATQAAAVAGDAATDAAAGKGAAGDTAAGDAAAQSGDATAVAGAGEGTAAGGGAVAAGGDDAGRRMKLWNHMFPETQPLHGCGPFEVPVTQAQIDKRLVSQRSLAVASTRCYDVELALVGVEGQRRIRAWFTSGVNTVPNTAHDQLMCAWRILMSYREAIARGKPVFVANHFKGAVEDLRKESRNSALASIAVLQPRSWTADKALTNILQTRLHLQDDGKWVRHAPPDTQSLDPGLTGELAARGHKRTASGQQGPAPHKIFRRGEDDRTAPSS